MRRLSRLAALHHHFAQLLVHLPAALSPGVGMASLHLYPKPGATKNVISWADSGSVGNGEIMACLSVIESEVAREDIRSSCPWLQCLCVQGDPTVSFSGGQVVFDQSAFQICLAIMLG
jgi:hypothetical protein